MTEKMILDVTPLDSVAYKSGITGGEEVISLNGDHDFELIDFIYATILDDVTLELKNENSLIQQYKLSKDEDAQFGLLLKRYPIRACRNKCIFCYIAQLPKGLRDSLYIKDDDFQLSFLTGSYISLSNFTYADIDKIKKYSLSPLYISLHTTDLKLRNFMMGNANLPDPIAMIKTFAKNNISMHFQVVLCPSINDGNYLKKTIEDVAKFYPFASSIALVPVSSTKFRANPEVIKKIDPQYSKTLIEYISTFQKKFYKKYGENFVYLSDEFYLSAGLDLPDEEEYFGYPQIENGVGLSRKFLTEFDKSIKKINKTKKILSYKSCTIVTGKLFENKMNGICKKLKKTFGLDVNVLGIENEFLGKTITVTGLLSGTDIIRSIKNKNIKETILIPDVIFSDACGLTLDNMTQDIIRSKIGLDIRYVSPTSAEAMFETLFKRE
jgi:putative radical SAM enzyme (TIGR03279 family)